MVKSAFWKNILRGSKRNAAKLISLTVIMLLGIAFVAGLGTLSPTVLDSISAQLNAKNVPDVIVKCASEGGFTDADMAKLTSLDCVADAETLTAIDTTTNGEDVRIYIYDDFGASIGSLDINGKTPSKFGEIMSERQNNSSNARAIGDEVTLDISGIEMTFTVTGVVSNPLLFGRLGEPSLVTQNKLNDIFYLSAAALPVDDIPLTDAYVRVAGIDATDRFDGGYRDGVAAAAAEIEAALGENFTVMTPDMTASFAVAESYCEKIDVITLVFPVFFIAVAALVVMTTMTRMMEEERSSMGCMLSLGFDNAEILLKYLFMTAACCALATALGLVAGLTILPAAIIPAFDTIVFMPASAGTLHPATGLVSAAAMAAVVISVTTAVCLTSLKEQPARLLLQKAPRPGKRILLERAGFLWRRLPFKYKSSLRNIFRYKKHLLMTVISVAGSTALTFAGFGLLNIADSPKGGSFAGFGDSLRPISVVVIAFALLLCVFVIYNLTNMNIGERKREIATLGVLGYRDGEILGYIFREIFVMALFGAALGIGVGCILVQGVLSYLDFGSLADVEWYSYLLALAATMAFVGLTDLLLAPKILKTDMTSSLKSND